MFLLPVRGNFSFKPLPTALVGCKIFFTEFGEWPLISSVAGLSVSTPQG